MFTKPGNQELLHDKVEWMDEMRDDGGKDTTQLKDRSVGWLLSNNKIATTEKYRQQHVQVRFIMAATAHTHTGLLLSMAGVRTTMYMVSVWQ